MNYRVITSAVLATSLSAFAGQAYFIFKKDSTEAFDKEVEERMEHYGETLI